MSDCDNFDKSDKKGLVRSFYMLCCSAGGLIIQLMFVFEQDFWIVGLGLCFLFGLSLILSKFSIFWFFFPLCVLVVLFFAGVFENLGGYSGFLWAIWLLVFIVCWQDFCFQRRFKRLHWKKKSQIRIWEQMRAFLKDHSKLLLRFVVCMVGLVLILNLQYSFDFELRYSLALIWLALFQIGVEK